MTCASPGDPSFNSVVLLCHGDGTNGQTTFTDNSLSAHALTGTSSPTVETAAVKFGTGAIDCHTGGKVNVGSLGTDFDMGTGAFTMELWGYATTLPGGSSISLLSRWGASGNAFFFGFIGGSLSFFWPASNIGGAYAPTINTWVHYAVDRTAGGVIRVYADGVVQASVTNAFLFDASSIQPLYIGGSATITSWTGYIDDCRVTKGVARYGGAFTPPTAAFPNGLPCPPGGGLMFRGVGSLAFPSPGLIAALGGARAILRNKPTTRRGLLRPW